MRKIGLLSLALVLALGAIGVGYAAWTQTLYIEGTVETGVLCVEFGNANVLDPYQPDNPGGDFPTDLPDWTCNDGFVPRDEDGLRFWPLDKNVGWGTVERVFDEERGYKTLLVTLYNAYPSYFNEVRFYPENCGTLPWRVDHVVVSWEQNDVAQEFVITRAGTLVQMDYTGDGQFELELMWGNTLGAQVHPDDFPPETSFWIHLLQPAPQNSTLEFTVSFVVVQWNKYPLDLVA